MNILIIGGLLGLAVVAILVAILLGVSEDRSEKARKAQEEAQNSVPAPRAQSLPAPGQPSAYQSVPATPILSRPTIPLPVSHTGETTGSLGLADLNGQVHEITGELRVLAQRASELQQRLNVLSDTLERQGMPRSEIPYANPPANLFSSDSETQVF